MTLQEQFERLRRIPGAQVSLIGDELIWHGPGPMPDPETLPPPQPPAPFVITRAQLLLWLHRHNVSWSQVTTWAQQLPAPLNAEVTLFLNAAIEFNRRDPLIKQAAIALGFATAATVDAVLEAAWTEAATIRLGE